MRALLPVAIAAAAGLSAQPPTTISVEILPDGACSIAVRGARGRSEMSVGPPCRPEAFLRSHGPWSMGGPGAWPISPRRRSSSTSCRPRDRTVLEALDQQPARKPFIRTAIAREQNKIRAAIRDARRLVA